MRFFEFASTAETLLNALIVMSITFAVLIMLFLLVRLLSLLLGSFSKKQQNNLPSQGAVETRETSEPTAAADKFSAGTLILKDVDEATAAMIMAIVSDESGIPLERLIFRSIKLVKEES